MTDYLKAPKAEVHASPTILLIFVPGGSEGAQLLPVSTYPPGGHKGLGHHRPKAKPRHISGFSSPPEAGSRTRASHHLSSNPYSLFSSPVQSRWLRLPAGKRGAAAAAEKTGWPADDGRPGNTMSVLHAHSLGRTEGARPMH